MTLSVYKLIRQTKVLHGRKYKFLLSIVLGGEKYTKCGQLIQGFTVAKQVVYFSPKLRPGALATSLLI